MEAVRPRIIVSLVLAIAAIAGMLVVTRAAANERDRAASIIRAELEVAKANADVAAAVREIDRLKRELDAIDQQIGGVLQDLQYAGDCHYQSETQRRAAVEQLHDIQRQQRQAEREVLRRMSRATPRDPAKR
jgi:septal ring factor EnvC (AmiA/AmiB activator)